MREISISTLGFRALEVMPDVWKTAFGAVYATEILMLWVDQVWRAGNTVTLDGRDIPPPEQITLKSLSAVREALRSR